MTQKLDKAVVRKEADKVVFDRTARFVKDLFSARGKEEGRMEFGGFDFEVRQTATKEIIRIKEGKAAFLSLSHSRDTESWALDECGASSLDKIRGKLVTWKQAFDKELFRAKHVRRQPESIAETRVGMSQ